ncbi:MAG: Bor family protein [Myxococcota bacterium]|nr:Bor family protein [Myxococcota bacterium]
MKRLIVSVAILLFVSGCATHTFHVNRGNASPSPAENTMQPFFLAGIFQSANLDASQICGGADKVAKVETEISFFNGLLAVVTIGFFTPLQAKVYCSN